MIGRLALALAAIVRVSYAQFRFTFPAKQTCQEWSASAPMSHAGMNMGRRAQTMNHAGMDMGPTIGQVRKYYIAADLDMWDYAPAGMDVAKNQTFPTAVQAPVASDGHAHDHSVGRRREQAMDHSTMAGGGHAGHGPSTWVTRSQHPPRIGRSYVKMRFNEYTDHTFTMRKARPTDEEHLGILGPTIRAEVGDTIRVVFRNNGPSGYPFSLHPHGVHYTKANEGASYNDGSDMTGDMIHAGHCAYYEWTVPESSGPGPGDPSTIAWLYHGHVAETADPNAGLVGAIIVGRAGSTDTVTRKPTDVDREFVTLFNIMDENDSPFLAENAWLYLGLNDSIPSNSSALASLRADADFKESNEMHVINGFVYGNLPGLVMVEGEMVRWHTLALGNQEDLHTPHWHGQTLLAKGGARVDVVNLLPATQLTLEARMENPGTWLYHCHVNHHIHAGMVALYTVTPCAGCTGNALAPAPMMSMSAMAQEIEDLKARDEALTAILACYAIIGFLVVLGYCLSHTFGVSWADCKKMACGTDQSEKAAAVGNKEAKPEPNAEV